MHSNRHYAFTLVEVLTVIAITAVLAGILFPIFARAKEDSLQVACLSQMSQLGKAYIMYSDEADDKLLPSTNYGLGKANPDRLWTNCLKTYAKDEKLFVAPGSEGVYADKWENRGAQTIGYNSSTAVDPAHGCNEDQADVSGCLAFRTVTNFSKNDPTYMALFAVTPGGDVKNNYLGYEFSPYNGVPNPENPRLTPPLVSDRDLVKEIKLPAEFIKPVHARYMSTGSDDGETPLVFGDGHAKTYSAKALIGNDMKLLWRLR